MAAFRVYFADGAVLDVPAESPDAARKVAQRLVATHGVITKCKRDRARRA